MFKEKYHNLASMVNLINKTSKLVSKFRHENKFHLVNYKVIPPDTEWNLKWQLVALATCQTSSKISVFELCKSFSIAWKSSSLAWNFKWQICKSWIISIKLYYIHIILIQLWYSEFHAGGNPTIFVRIWFTYEKLYNAFCTMQVASVLCSLRYTWKARICFDVCILILAPFFCSTSYFLSM